MNAGELEKPPKPAKEEQRKQTISSIQPLYIEIERQTLALPLALRVASSIGSRSPFMVTVPLADGRWNLGRSKECAVNICSSESEYRKTPCISMDHD